MNYIEKQKYSECQLVSACNAAIHLGLPIPEGDEYEEMVDAVRARHGSALDMRPAFKKLGLKYDLRPLRMSSVIKALKKGSPVGFSLRSLQYGMHSVMGVACRRKGAGWQIRLTNFSKEYEVDREGRIIRRFLDGWLPWSRIEKNSLSVTDFGRIQSKGSKRCFIFRKR